jgi:eukaryotic-like serine/threonine-protein kinase
VSASVNREREIFCTALEHTVPADLAAYLDEVCGENTALRQSVESLLRVHEAERGVLTERDQTSNGDIEAPIREGPGARIGRYKLLERIGEGGFGVVYMAEQEEPVRRRVALKVIKLGMDTRAVVTRFEAERQALALMEHPNIARVFDGGATETGRPYFVMELVRGVPITRYCDENRLPPKARLRLFITVCHAVQHAHQKGVIHRDLKPSNILVTLHDGVPVPKVIDFGIAKATSAHLTDKTLFTRFHMFIGTPAYTSPEQMEMSELDVDTRSDIYSLGVLLYELLAGRPPFDPDALLKSGLDAMRRTIREVDPPRPSIRLATLSHTDRTSVAQVRGTDASKLSLLLRGDLDWVIMRSLEKDRTRRYETPAALAADIERHLASEPVAARPPSNVYRLRKFIRRHRVGFFATTAVATALIVGLIASSILLVREQLARARAVTAERTAVDLQHQAEVARAEEVKRAARTSLELANRNLSDGRVADGLAYLAYAARKDPLNPILAPRLASVLASHNFVLPESPPFECGSRVIALRYALDGRTFMAGTEDGMMRVFDSATGKVVREFRLGKPVCWITGSMFARANDRIFGARFPDNALMVFDATTGGSPHRASIQLDHAVMPVPDAVGLSPDGRWIFAYTPGVGKFWLWDALTGEERLAQSLERRNLDFDFSADGRLLSIAAGDEVRLWSLPDCVPTVEPIRVERAPGRKDSWMFARFSPDSRHLAIIDPYAGIQLCDTAMGALPGPRIDMEGSAFVKAWEFSPDGRLLCVGEKTSEIRDLATGRIISLPFSSRDGFSFQRSFSRDGSLLLVTPTKEGLASLWDTKTGAAIAEFTLRLPANIRGALSPNGAQIVVGTSEGAIHRLQVGRGIARPLVLARPQPLLPLAFLPDAPARLLWLTDDRSRVLDVASGREAAGGFTFPRKLTQAAPGDANKSALRSDLKFLLVRNGAEWEAWELSAGGAIKVVPLQDKPPPNGIITFNPVADLVAINDLARIRVWDLRTGACVGPPINPGFPLAAQSVNFTPDGRRLAASYILGAPVIWEVATSRPATGTFEPNPERSFSSVQFSPDGTKIVTADFRGEARLWDTATGAPLSPVIRAADMLYQAAFSPDGLYFTTRSSAELRIWDAKTAEVVGEPITLLGSGMYLRFSSDGRRLAAECQDGKVHLLDVRSAHAFAEPMNHGAVRTSVGGFSPDGLFVRTETSANDFRIWSVPPALPDGTPPPEWLLQLATACAGKVVNDQGQLADVSDAAAKIESLRAQVDALPANTPLADWGRWILNDRADRSIAPGFTITPPEAEALKARLVAAANQ